MILSNIFTQRSSTSSAAPITFEKKQDGCLQQCVDYSALNSATYKNWYPLPLISEMLDPVRRALIFSGMDLRNSYHLIRIKEDHKRKTAFCSYNGPFESHLMTSGSLNTAATFQVYSDYCLWPNIDDFPIWYLDGILINSPSEQKHDAYIKPCWNDYANSGSIAELKSTNSGLWRSAYMDLSSVPTGSAWNHTANQPSRTGLRPSQSETNKCF